MISTRTRDTKLQSALNVSTGNENASPKVCIVTKTDPKNE